MLRRETVSPRVCNTRTQMRRSISQWQFSLTQKSKKTFETNARLYFVRHSASDWSPGRCQVVAGWFLLVWVKKPPLTSLWRSDTAVCIYEILSSVQSTLMCVYLWVWEGWEEVVGVRWCHHSPLWGPCLGSTQHMETHGVRWHTKPIRLENSKHTQDHISTITITITPHDACSLRRFHKRLQTESGNATVHASHPHTSRPKDRTVRRTYEATRRNARCCFVRFTINSLCCFETQCRYGRNDTLVLRFPSPSPPKFGNLDRQPRITHNSEKDDVKLPGLFGGLAGPAQNRPIKYIHASSKLFSTNVWLNMTWKEPVLPL